MAKHYGGKKKKPMGGKKRGGGKKKKSNGLTAAQKRLRMALQRAISKAKKRKR